MEDSHIALTDISDSQIKEFLDAAAAKSAGDANVSLFGVFDGHGGKHTIRSQLVIALEFTCAPRCLNCFNLLNV